MKTIWSLVFLCILPLVGYSRTPSDEFQVALDETGITARERPPQFSETVYDPNYLADLKKLPPDRQAKLAEQLTQLAPRLAEEERVQTNPLAVGPMLAILLLTDIGTDEQKIEAFSNLELYTVDLRQACEALATCEGSGGVAILKMYAESQFSGIESEFIEAKSGTSFERYAGKIRPSGKFLQALIALQSAYHNSGPTAANTLYVRFTSLTTPYLTERDRAKLQKEMEKARHKRENLIREKRPTHKRNSTLGSTEMETPEPVSDSLSIGSSKWVWPGIAIAFFTVLAGWFFMKRKD